uniref:Multiple epidermal growth factor-like domains protein 10 isoform X1 n=1 Tax=Crassostrea virginica TaxID=6565 RepID=A0A8B8BP42_CRAVI|nr:multiple epidermal growth factor-like domains protein 10 isoform X1 [Crassostrea virginica]
MSTTLFIHLGFIVSSFAYENIALKKPAYQQYPYTGPGPANHLMEASNAVDGLKTNLSIWGGQCVLSDNDKQTATWWVNLTSILSIHHVTIYYRTEVYGWVPDSDFPSRFLGFSVYVSNTTDKLQGTMCYKDTNFTLDSIPPMFYTTCPLHGQYVFFYNERLANVSYPVGYSHFAYNDLCEVEVFGCPTPGLYGSNCSIPCPDPNCRYCHIEAGTCQGCKPGYQGHRCELAECRHGQYGEACENVCGQCIDQSECHHVNGTCLNGCRPGYKGNHCSQTCEFGFYGDQCTQECGNCHNQTNCRHTNGSCASGCDVGFHGDLCKTECESGTYGHQCEEKCGQCKDLSKCLNTNGLCLTGCQEGYHGDLCKTRTSPKADEPVRNGWQMGGYMTSVGLIMIILFTLVYIVILSLIRIFRRCTPASQQDMKRENLNSAIKQKDSTEHAYTNRSYVELSDCRNGPEIENHETSADV